MDPTPRIAQPSDFGNVAPPCVQLPSLSFKLPQSLKHSPKTPVMPSMLKPSRNLRPPSPSSPPYALETPQRIPTPQDRYFCPKGTDRTPQENPPNSSKLPQRLGISQAPVHRAPELRSPCDRALGAQSRWVGFGVWCLGAGRGGVKLKFWLLGFGRGLWLRVSGQCSYTTFFWVRRCSDVQA